MMNRVAMAGLIVVIVLLVGYFGVSAVVYNRLSSVKATCVGHPEDVENTPAAFRRDGFDTTPYLVKNYEEVRFPSRDAKITISAFYLPAQGITPETAPAVVVVHGLDDCRRRPFVLTAGGMLSKNGINALIIDLRDHGDSTVEDGRMAAGTEEYKDVLGAWDWLVNEQKIPERRVGLMGFSLGAATVMIAAGEEPKVAAVWEDSGFGDIGKILQSELARAGVPGIFAWGGIQMGKLLAQDDVTGLTPIQEVAKLGKRPIFMVHGNADQRVNVQHAYDLARVVNASGGSVEPWITEGAQHIESIFDYPSDYERKLVGFFEWNLR